MRKSDKAKSLKRRIADFRLTAASVILGNLPHISHGTRDMRHISHMAELCEQYSLLIVLNWIATKYGFPVCAESISSASTQNALPLLSWPSLADRYPLQVYGDPRELVRTFEELKTLLEQLFEANFELVGSIYQQMLSAPLAIKNDAIPYIDLKSDQRLSGEFYTPDWVADYAFEQWLNADSAALLSRFKEQDPSLYPKIIDPSCGSGNFLHAALRLSSRLEISAQSRIEFLANALYGRDIDGRAVQLTKLCLLIAVGGELNRSAEKEIETSINRLIKTLDRNILVDDSLLAAISEGEQEKFDLVITNPPYISFGSRDQQNIGAVWQKLLKRRFPASSEYKIRFTSIFQEIAIDWSRLSGRFRSERRGQAILLVPDAFLSGRYYEKLRNLLLEKVNLEAFTELPESTISDATVGRWCLAHYSEKPVDDSVDEKLKQVKLSSIASQEELNSRLTFTLPKVSLVSTDRQRFQLLFSEADLEIFEYCRKLPWLKSKLQGHTGIRARRGQSSIIAEHKKNEQCFAGIISGAELAPYRIDWQGKWLEIVPENLYAGGFAAETINGPKILLRQTADSLIAAVDQSGLYHLNNVHSFVPLSGKLRESRTYFFCALLNSAFYRYFYRLKTREYKRALAQVDIETVEHMPLAPENAALEGELEELGRKLHLFPRKHDLFEQIERLVFELFGFSESMRLHIMKDSHTAASGRRPAAGCFSQVQEIGGQWR
ncbi:MAG: N-6 DNA methylase [Candidatus Obscuribacterales bacterium]|nr:N-6 DNA methylase [Candidatus Obscuribacterales bacterium]